MSKNITVRNKFTVIYNDKYSPDIPPKVVVLLASIMAAEISQMANWNEFPGSGILMQRCSSVRSVGLPILCKKDISKKHILSFIHQLPHPNANRMPLLCVHLEVSEIQPLSLNPRNDCRYTGK